MIFPVCRAASEKANGGSHVEERERARARSKNTAEIETELGRRETLAIIVIYDSVARWRPHFAKRKNSRGEIEIEEGREGGDRRASYRFSSNREIQRVVRKREFAGPGRLPERSLIGALFATSWKRRRRFN